MTAKPTCILGVVAVSMLPGAALAGPCDYKPSKLAAKAGTAIGSGVRAGTSAAVDAAKAAGHYALMHPGQGLAMASTAAGNAGGLAAGAAGVVGTIGTILTAPITLTVGAVTFGAVGTYEGLCYFSVDRVTDEAEVRRILENIASNDRNVDIAPGGDGDWLVLIRDRENETYLLRELYIADGVLKHRDWGPNRNLGSVAFVSPEEAGAAD